MKCKNGVAPYMSVEIVIRPQPKAYEGVKHSVTQKVTELRGEAHLPLKLAGSIPAYIIWYIYKSKRLLLSQTESVLMPDREESGHLEGRKPKGVGVKVVQCRGLAAPVRNEMSREGRDIKCG